MPKLWAEDHMPLSLSILNHHTKSKCNLMLTALDYLAKMSTRLAQKDLFVYYLWHCKEIVRLPKMFLSDYLTKTIL